MGISISISYSGSAIIFITPRGLIYYGLIIKGLSSSTGLSTFFVMIGNYFFSSSSQGNSII